MNGCTRNTTVVSRLAVGDLGEVAGAISVSGATACVHACVCALHAVHSDFCSVV